MQLSRYADDFAKMVAVKAKMDPAEQNIYAD